MAVVSFSDCRKLNVNRSKRFKDIYIKFFNAIEFIFVLASIVSQIVSHIIKAELLSSSFFFLSFFFLKQTQALHSAK